MSKWTDDLDTPHHLSKRQVLRVILICLVALAVLLAGVIYANAQPIVKLQAPVDGTLIPSAPVLTIPSVPNGGDSGNSVPLKAADIEVVSACCMDETCGADSPTTATPRASGQNPWGSCLQRHITRGEDVGAGHQPRPRTDNLLTAADMDIVSACEVKPRPSVGLEVRAGGDLAPVSHRDIRGSSRRHALTATLIGSYMAFSVVDEKQGEYSWPSVSLNSSLDRDSENLWSFEFPTTSDRQPGSGFGVLAAPRNWLRCSTLKTGASRVAGVGNDWSRGQGIAAPSAEKSRESFQPTAPPSSGASTSRMPRTRGTAVGASRCVIDGATASQIFWPTWDRGLTAVLWSASTMPATTSPVTVDGLQLETKPITGEAADVSSSTGSSERSLSGAASPASPTDAFSRDSIADSRQPKPYQKVTFLTAAGGLGILSYGVLSVVDAAQTRACLNAGTCREANVLLKPFAGSPNGLVAVKLAANSATAYGIWRMRKKHPKAALGLAIAAAGFQAVIVAKNVRVARGQR